MCKEKRSFWDRNGLFFAVLSLLLSFWLILLIAITPVHAATSSGGGSSNDLLISETDTDYTLDFTSNYKLYYNDNRTPISLQFLKDNPDFGVYLYNLSENARYSYSDGLTQTIIIAGNERTLNWSLVSSVYDKISSNYTGAELEAILNSPIEFSRLYDFTSEISFNVYKTGQTVTEKEEDPGILEGIEGFFTALMKPFVSFFETIGEFFNSFGSVAELWEKFEGYTITPVVEFFNETLNSGALSAFVQIWEFPIIKELLIAVVSVLVIGGIMLLFTSL